jgi:hypothetical protein
MSVAGLLALAQAFSQPGARPRRSLLFVATSGGDEFWGSRYFLSQLRPRREVVPRLVVTLALGSRLASDSMTVAGLEEVDLAPSPVWTAALHAELGVAVVDTGSVLAPTAEASVFADRWLPVLAVQAGRPVASPDGGRLVSPDAAAAARVLQLLFYTIHALANDDRTPAWTPAARQQIAPPLP